MRTLKLLVFKDLLMQRRGFHLGSSTWMKTQSQQCSAQESSPWPAEMFVHVGLHGEFPFAVALGGRWGLTQCSEVRGHVFVHLAGPTPETVVLADLAQRPPGGANVCRRGPEGAGGLAWGHQIQAVRLRDANQQAPQE